MPPPESARISTRRRGGPCGRQLGQGEPGWPRCDRRPCSGSVPGLSTMASGSPDPSGAVIGEGGQRVESEGLLPSRRGLVLFSRTPVTIVASMSTVIGPPSAPGRGLGRPACRPAPVQRPAAPGSLSAPGECQQPDRRPAGTPPGRTPPARTGPARRGASRYRPGSPRPAPASPPDSPRSSPDRAPPAAAATAPGRRMSRCSRPVARSARVRSSTACLGNDPRSVG